MRIGVSTCRTALDGRRPRREYSRDAQLPFAAAGLGDAHPAHGLRLVAAVEQARDERLLVLPDPTRQLIDAHAVDPRRTLVGDYFRIRTVQVVGLDDLLHQS